MLPTPPSLRLAGGEPVLEGRPRGGRALTLAGGPAACAVVLALPLPGLTPEAHRLAAIFAWAVIYWITEALPLGLTALLASALAIALGVAPARTVLAPYADPVIFLFVGSFVLAEAMKTTALDRRLAATPLGARGPPARRAGSSRQSAPSRARSRSG